MALRAIAGGVGGGSGTITSVNGQTGPTVTITSANINALGLPVNWNASTNTPTLTSSVAPTNNNAYLVTVSGTTTLDGISTWNQGDITYFGAGGTWQRIAGVANVTALQKGDGVGGLTSAALGVDYGAPITVQNGIEIYRAPSGTMGNNGAVTLGTALPAALPDGCWMEFPAGAIATGIPSSAQVTAGVKWWTTFVGSTTVGQVYNNTYTPGTGGAAALLPPASPTAFSTTGPGAYTNNTSASIAYSITVPGNTLGAHGSIDYEIWCSSNNSAGSKTVSCLFGGSGAGANITMTTGVQQALLGNVMNKGYTNRQKSSQAGKSFSGNQSKNTSSVDTTTSQTFNINFNAAVAGDYVCIESLKLTITGAP